MHGMHGMDADDNSNLELSGVDKRQYRKKKSWLLTLKVTIETPDLDNKLNESFDIEIGSNQRLKILQQTILSYVKNIELRELIKREKMYIYIDGKEPVARKSKSLQEMGVKDNDNLIVTTEMKLPFNNISDDEDVGLFPSQQLGNIEDPFEMSGPGSLMQKQGMMDSHNMHGGPSHYRDMQDVNQGGMGGPMMMNQGMKSNGEHSNFMDVNNLPMHMKQDTGKHDYGVPGMHPNPNPMHLHKQL